MPRCGHCCAVNQPGFNFIDLPRFAGSNGRQSSQATRLRWGNKKMGAKMADQWVRLGMAIVIIVLISIGLYQFSGRASAIEPTFSGITYRP